jgi:hypothetical protein
MSSRTSNADEARSDVAFETESGNTLAAEGAQTCCKCGVGVTAANLGSLGKKSKQVIHTACGSFYKQIAKKMTKDPVYKSWWDSRTFDAMCIIKLAVCMSKTNINTSRQSCDSTLISI